MADNVGSFPFEMGCKAYVAWVQDPANGFASTTLPLRGSPRFLSLPHHQAEVETARVLTELSLRVAEPTGGD